MTTYPFERQGNQLRDIILMLFLYSSTTSTLQLLLLNDLVLIVQYELAVIQIHSINKGIVELTLINIVLLLRRTF